MSFGFGFGFTKITAAIRAAFSPSSLFAANEPGVWYDPSDLSTLFQDAAGTTPVTAVEQPVGLMLDKSKGLVLGPELVTNGDFSNGTTGWSTGSGASSISVVSGRLEISGSINGFRASSAITTVSGRWYKATINTSASGTRLLVSNNSDGSVQYFTAVLVSGDNTVYFSATASKTYICPAQAVNSTATFSVDNISVRELPGNHAYQTTATSRPVLSARYNLLTKTEQFDDAAWTKVRSNITQNAAVAPDGTFTADKWIEDTTTANNHLIYGTLAAFTTGVSYTMSLYAKAAERSFIQLTTGLAVGGETRWANFNLSNGTIGSFGADATPSITAVGNGWFHCQIVFISSTTAIENLTAALVTSATAERLEAYTGDGTSGIYIWGASLVPANQASLPYQRVNTATDYDTAGFPHYLRFDGVDDWLVTNTNTPGIDKVQVFAGVRKLSGAAMVFWEHGNNQAGGFTQGNYNAAGQALDHYNFWSRGSTTLGFAWSGGYPAPTTNTLTGIGDISGDSAILRVNGTQAAISTADQGTGNYLAYPLYIGRRGGTTAPFNGHLYSLIVRFGSNLTDATIENTEKYINTKTRAY